MKNEEEFQEENICICPHDGSPVIFTLAFKYAEYYCPECKGKFGMFDVDSAPSTPELQKRLDVLKQQNSEYLKSVAMRSV